jgi:large subunit ribosomal protein L30
MAGTAKKKAAAGSKTITVVQTGGHSGRTDRQIATLKGLGLRGRHSTRELQDNPAVRGMIEKVRHIVRVVGEEN